MKPILAAIPLIWFVSCAKNYGCDDSHAINYDKDVRHNDNSCIYVADLEVFPDYSDTAYLAALGCVYYHLSLDGVHIGSDSVVHCLPKYGSEEDVDGIIYKDTLYWKRRPAYFEIFDQDSNLIEAYNSEIYGGPSYHTLQLTY